MLHALSAALAVSMAAHGWGSGHTVIRQTAIDWLPQWQQELLGASAQKLSTQYASLQDQFAAGNRPELEPYCRVPDLALSLHDVCPIAVGPRGIRWYLERIAEQIAAGNSDEAAKYLGVLCHWIEDPASPSMHCVQGVIDEYKLRELLPPPPEKRRYHYLYGYSGIADRGEYHLPPEDYTPRLLGRSFDEAALHLYQAQRWNAKRARAALVPIVSDEMYGDGAEASALRSQLVFEAAKTTADVIFTALCLAAVRCGEADSAHLDAVPLTDFISEYKGGSAGFPYKWVPFLEDACFDQQRNLLPLQLPGPQGPQSFARGLGMGVPFALSYALAPGGVFTRFTALVGLHPAAGKGGAVRFAVKVNGAVAATVGPVMAGEPGQRLEVPLPADPVVTLTLVTEAGPGSSESDNLAVWAEPTLHAGDQEG